MDVDTSELDNILDEVLGEDVKAPSLSPCSGAGYCGGNTGHSGGASTGYSSYNSGNAGYSISNAGYGNVGGCSNTVYRSTSYGKENGVSSYGSGNGTSTGSGTSHNYSSGYGTSCASKPKATSEVDDLLGEMLSLDTSDCIGKGSPPPIRQQATTYTTRIL